MDDSLEAAIQLYLLNRGVLITPFHNMMLCCPVTAAADIDALLQAFSACLAELLD
jgi:glutamate-1-semialdehyde 2,1-aminomutase